MLIMKLQIKQYVESHPNSYGRYITKQFPNITEIVKHCDGDSIPEQIFNFINDSSKRICKCGKPTSWYGQTRGYAEFCTVKCRVNRERLLSIESYYQRLTNLGYVIHTNLETINGNKDKIDVTNTRCGHRYSAHLSNILNQRSICGVCGPTKRIKNATDSQRRSYDVTLWRDYRDTVRKLTDEYYDSNKSILNPNNHNRSRPDLDPVAVQIDHIIPIIYGFKNNLSPELIANPLNLRMLSAKDNLKKKQKLTTEAKALLKRLKIII